MARFLALLLLAGCAPAEPVDTKPPADVLDARYAALRDAGVDWIAIGQEPGWTAEVRDGERIEVVADYGERRAIVPAPRAGGGVSVEYHSVTEANDVRLKLTRGACADAMSGRRYPARAVLVFNGRRYEGCAQPL